MRQRADARFRKALLTPRSISPMAERREADGAQRPREHRRATYNDEATLEHTPNRQHSDDECAAALHRHVPQRAQCERKTSRWHSQHDTWE